MLRAIRQALAFIAPLVLMGGAATWLHILERPSPLRVGSTMIVATALAGFCVWLTDYRLAKRPAQRSRDNPNKRVGQ